MTNRMQSLDSALLKCYDHDLDWSLLPPRIKRVSSYFNCLYVTYWRLSHQSIINHSGIFSNKESHHYESDAKFISKIVIWPVRPRAQFPWKTIREKVPYEGRTRRSDRAGKPRTALLETSTAKSMWVNDKNNFVAANVCSLQNESWKWTFSKRILLSRRIVPCRNTSSVANSLRKRRKKFNTPCKWRSSQLYQKPTSKHAVKETTSPDKLSYN